MHCDEQIVKMNMYLDGELPASQISELLQHIEECESCKKRFEGLKMVAFEMRHMDDALPDGLHDSIMQKIKAQKRPVKRNYTRWIVGVSAAMVLLVLMVSGVLPSLRHIYLFNESASSGDGSSQAPMSAPFGAADDSATAEMGAAAAPEATPPLFAQSPDSDMNTGSADRSQVTGAGETESAIADLGIDEGYYRYIVTRGSGSLPASLKNRPQSIHGGSNTVMIEVPFDDIGFSSVELQYESLLSELWANQFEVIFSADEYLPEPDENALVILVIVLPGE